MQSSIIGKIEKARRYAAEPERFCIEGFTVTVRGDNTDHRVEFADEVWTCTCGFFAEWSICSHTMAIERVLAGLVPAQPLPFVSATGT
ncbi:MAG: hypothetical protein OXI51_09725 [Chloroflexota bacterium]|nr:hypothetical protein [Chloroflexota bacterium]